MAIEVSNDARYDGEWECYYCGDIRERVVRLSHLEVIDDTYEYLCETCLWHRVVDGDLLVAHPSQLEEMEPAPPPDPNIPVLAEGGAIQFNDVEVQWQQ